MNPIHAWLSVSIILSASLAMVLHGPIAQLPHYHDFADTRVWLGVPYAADVLSNAGFGLVGLWALWRLWPMRRHPALAVAWPGYATFFVALALTGLGSGYYHLAPDNARLVWDRLPIALACAGLLAAVLAETHPGSAIRPWLVGLAGFAVASVAWWYHGQLQGQGDLRPYLLIQVLPLVLIPLWQAGAVAPRADRVAFAAALFCYVLAKAAEWFDHPILVATGVFSGHSLKHGLATLAAALLAARLWRRVGGGQ